jgi:hypothetical protein
MIVNEFVPAIASILAAIIGLAIIAVLVGQKSQTSTVIAATGTAFSGIINAAVSPVATSSGNIGNGTLG